MGPIVVDRGELLLLPSHDISDKDRHGMKNTTLQRPRDTHKGDSVPVQNKTCGEDQYTTGSDRQSNPLNTRPHLTRFTERDQKRGVNNDWMRIDNSHRRSARYGPGRCLTQLPYPSFVSCSIRCFLALPLGGYISCGISPEKLESTHQEQIPVNVRVLILPRKGIGIIGHRDGRGEPTTDTRLR